MSQTFLEKYTVAPAPSRDYYGLKIQEDEVKLFHWPIRQRPHKVPITRTSSFSNWTRDMVLQSEIEQVFGNSWLQYTNDLIEKKKSLLTLPRKILKNILTFLPAKDISQLFLLSRAFYEILNNESTWELIFKKVKGEDFYLAQKGYGMSYGWKQLLKETQGIEIKPHIPKTLRPNKSLSSRGDPPKSTQSHRTKSEFDVKKISLSRKTAPHPLSLQNLQLNIENAPEDKPKLLHKNSREIKFLGAPYDDQLEKNQTSVNILTLQSTDLSTKLREPEPERPKNFRASPAPRSTYQSGGNGETIPQSKVWNRRKGSSPSTSSLSSLRTKETLLENSVKTSLSDFKKTKDLFSSEFDWLTGPRSLDAPGDGLKPSDTNWIAKTEKLTDEHKFTSPMSQFKRGKESISKDLELKKGSTDDSRQDCSPKSTKTSVSIQSVGHESLRSKSGFHLLNSEYLKRGLGLQPRAAGSNYSLLSNKLKNHKLKGSASFGTKYYEK
ncbi:uncharacterized protein LOC107043571 [Diachasma alloeum]|uniref:uncharacterized protein LOC107043571 n=1 Tax=Diachasma alloeum TaxID=454923 RepID=UPI0007383CEC|nr:uncharacterized protein LOC107043571 [Diachasma alloeum]